MDDLKFKINTDAFLPLRDVVFNTLRDAILTGKINPGERLLENRLADQLGVSRTPVREALRILEQEHLVSIAPRKGAQVLEIGEKDIVDILEVREALESLAIKLACAKIQPEDIRKLKHLEEDFEQATALNDVSRISQLDEDFHDTIFEITNNDQLQTIYKNLRMKLYRYRFTHVKVASELKAIIKHHEHILEALESHNAVLGIAAISEHIKYHTDFILKYLKNK